VILARSQSSAPEVPDPDSISLFLDFDGTLVEIAPRPDAVAVEPALLRLLAALAERREQHQTLTIRSLDGGERRIEATAIPLEGEAGRLLGAVAIFWPADPA